MLMMVGSSAGFLRRGVTLACFSAAGTTPVVREELMVVVRNGEIAGAMFWSSGDGIGSSGHVVGRLDVISLRTSASVSGEKADSVKGKAPSPVIGGRRGWEKEVVISSIFFSK